MLVAVHRGDRSGEDGGKFGVGMIYVEGMHGRFRLGYGTQFIHAAAAMAEERAEINDLLACGADPTPWTPACTPMHYVAWSIPEGVVAAALFEAGVDSEACDGNGRKTLEYAISAVNGAFIKEALDAGADPAGSGEAVEDVCGTAR